MAAVDTSASYPVGKFRHQAAADAAARAAWIQDIRALPAGIRAATAGLDGVRLDTPYREGGWTVRQVVHHLADSHMNSLIRFKLALTEDSPRIKPYDQDAWAALADSRKLDIGPSLEILDGLHARWVTLMEGMEERDWGRTFDHPERGPMTLDHTLQLYAWHSRHHAAHITELRKRMGW